MESFDAVAVGLRAAAVVGALQAAGLSLFVAAHGATLAESAPPLLRLARALALAGIVLVLGHQTVEGTRLAGDWSGLIDIDTQRGNWHRSPGVAAMLCGGALAIGYVGCLLRGGSGTTLRVLGALGVVASFTLTGHTTGSTVSPLVRLVLAMHVAIVSYWLGSIVALMRLTRMATTEQLSGASIRFSASAVWIVPAILPLGLGLVAGLVPNLGALWNVYGSLLAVKVTGFAALLALAAFNRWRVVPVLVAQPAPATRRFRRTLQAEYLLVIGVLCVTVVMTSLFSWR